MSENQDQVLPFEIVEKSLPARINTIVLAGNHPPGYMCAGCYEVVSHPFGDCKCPEWIEANDRIRKKYEDYEKRGITLLRVGRKVKVTMKNGEVKNTHVEHVRHETVVFAYDLTRYHFDEIEKVEEVHETTS